MYAVGIVDSRAPKMRWRSPKNRIIGSLVRWRAYTVLDGYLGFAAEPYVDSILPQIHAFSLHWPRRACVDLCMRLQQGEVS